MPDWRNCSRGKELKYLISVSNWANTREEITLNVPFVAGFSLRDVVQNAKLFTSDGTIRLTMEPNEEYIFIATPVTSPPIITIYNGPGELVPKEEPRVIDLYYDASTPTTSSAFVVRVSVVRTDSSEEMTIASSSQQLAMTSGNASLSLTLPQSYDVTSSSSSLILHYPSSMEGGRYILLAELFDASNNKLANSSLDIFISFGVKLAGSLPLVSKTQPATAVAMPTGWESVFPLSRTEVFFPRYEKKTHTSTLPSYYKC